MSAHLRSDRTAAEQGGRRVATAVLALTLSVSLAFVVVHALAYVVDWRDVVDGDPLHTSMWSLEKDRGYPELWGYLVQAGIVAGLGLLLLTTRQWLYLAWAAVFGIALLDDGLHIHERVGGSLVRSLDLPAEVAGVDRQSLGELAIFALMAVVPLLAVLALHRRSDAVAQRHSCVLVGLLALLILFGVGVDLLHSLIGAGGDLAMVLGLVEDGAELLVLSVTVGVVAGFLAGRVTGARRPVPGAATEASPGAAPLTSGAPAVR